MLVHEDRETKLDLALECLASSGQLRLRVNGASMLPGIRPGSYVQIVRRATAQMSPGDVILARTAEGVRLHRLIEVRGFGANTLWITRGDNNDLCDPPLRSGQVLGVLARIEQPGPGRWFHHLLRIL